MPVKEISSEGLKHTFECTVPAKELDAKVEALLQETGKTLKMPGFRPGKVPLTLLKQRYGPQARKDAIEDVVKANASKTIKEKGLRPALQPKFDVTEIAEGKDLKFTIELETLPEIKPKDIKKLKVERLKVALKDADVKAEVLNVIKRSKLTQPVEKPRAAKQGDSLVIDFEGFTGDKPIQGGKAEDFKIELGSGQLIPGFEDQLVGAKPGEERTIEVTFPEDYQEKSLAGAKATFNINVKELHELQPAEATDEAAKALGFEDLKKLEETAKDVLGRDVDAKTFFIAKRHILDELASQHDFPVPQGLVDLEFNVIWEEVKAVAEQEKDEKKREKHKKQYQDIAQRRVRLGLLLAEIGRENKITVPESDVARALVAEARKYTGQEKEVLEFLRKDTQAQERIKAPIFENKVVEFILDACQVKEKEMSFEALEKEIEKLNKEDD